jgi:Nucleotide modification associated domain 2
LVADSGGAPCVRRGMLSLAICKPMIRETAGIGDLIFGFAANSLSPDNRLIYVTRITDKLSSGKYYMSDQYSRREDCIYEFKNARFVRRRGAKHHHRAEDLVHDLGSPPDYPRANVLLSTDFRYFGRAGTAEYKSKFSRVKSAVELLGRGHRVHHHSAELRDQLLAMADWIWCSATEKVIGPPTNAPSERICHREGPNCGIA